MASQQNKTLHSVVMNFIPKKVVSNNPPIIKTSLPNLDKPLVNETIKLSYDNICDVIIKEADLQQPKPASAPEPQQPKFVSAPKPIQQPKPQDNSVKTANLLEPGQTTLDNYVSVSVTKVQPKRLTKSAKVSAAQHELTVSPQTAFRRKFPLDKKTQRPILAINEPVQSQPLLVKQPQQPQQQQLAKQPQQQQLAKQQLVKQQPQHKPMNSGVHRGRTFEEEPPIYRGKNPFHEITLKSRKSKKNNKSKRSKKSKKSKKHNKKSKLKKKDKNKRVHRTQSLSAGSNTRETISNDIQNIMALF
jgi:hypothetical protein